MKKYKIILIFSLLLINRAIAYIDPGTRGLFISSFWSSIVGIFTAILSFVIISFFKPFKRRIRKKL